MRRLYLNICLKRRFLFWADAGKSICLLMRDSAGWQQVLKKSYISGSIWRKWVIQTVKYSIIKDMFCYSTDKNHMHIGTREPQGQNAWMPAGGTRRTRAVHERNPRASRGKT